MPDCGNNLELKAAQVSLLKEELPFWLMTPVVPSGNRRDQETEKTIMNPSKLFDTFQTFLPQSVKSPPATSPVWLWKTPPPPWWANVSQTLGPFSSASPPPSLLIKKQNDPYTFDMWRRHAGKAWRMPAHGSFEHPAPLTSKINCHLRVLMRDFSISSPLCTWVSPTFTARSHTENQTKYN